MSIETDQLKEMGITLEETTHLMQMSVTREGLGHDIVNLKLMFIQQLPKPCPFCASEEYLVYDDGIASCYVSCQYCKAEGPVCDTKTRAIAKWNKR